MYVKDEYPLKRIHYNRFCSCRRTEGKWSKMYTKHSERVLKWVLTHVTLVESAVLSLACRQRSHQRERPPDVGLAAVHIRKHSEERLG